MIPLYLANLPRVKLADKGVVHKITGASGYLSGNVLPPWEQLGGIRIAAAQLTKHQSFENR
jgi:hypothetical protein